MTGAATFLGNACTASKCVFSVLSFLVWPKAKITVAWGIAPGMVCVWRLVWLKAIFTPGVGENG